MQFVLDTTLVKSIIKVYRRMPQAPNFVISPNDLGDFAPFFAPILAARPTGSSHSKEN